MTIHTRMSVIGPMHWIALYIGDSILILIQEFLHFREEFKHVDKLGVFVSSSSTSFSCSLLLHLRVKVK